MASKYHITSFEGAPRIIVVAGDHGSTPKLHITDGAGNLVIGDDSKVSLYIVDYVLGLLTHQLQQTIWKDGAAMTGRPKVVRWINSVRTLDNTVTGLWKTKSLTLLDGTVKTLDAGLVTVMGNLVNRSLTGTYRDWEKASPVPIAAAGIYWTHKLDDDMARQLAEHVQNVLREANIALGNIKLPEPEPEDEVEKSIYTALQNAKSGLNSMKMDEVATLAAKIQDSIDSVTGRAKVFRSILDNAPKINADIPEWKDSDLEGALMESDARQSDMEEDKVAPNKLLKEMLLGLGNTSMAATLGKQTKMASTIPSTTSSAKDHQVPEHIKYQRIVEKGGKVTVDMLIPSAWDAYLTTQQNAKGDKINQFYDLGAMPKTATQNSLYETLKPLYPKMLQHGGAPPLSDENIDKMVSSAQFFYSDAMRETSISAEKLRNVFEELETSQRALMDLDNIMTQATTAVNLSGADQVAFIKSVEKYATETDGYWRERNKKLVGSLTGNTETNALMVAVGTDLAPDISKLDTIIKSPILKAVSSYRAFHIMESKSEEDLIYSVGLTNPTAAAVTTSPDPKVLLKELGAMMDGTLSVEEVSKSVENQKLSLGNTVIRQAQSLVDFYDDVNNSVSGLVACSSLKSELDRARTMLTQQNETDLSTIPPVPSFTADVPGKIPFTVVQWNDIAGDVSNQVAKIKEANPNSSTQAELLLNLWRDTFPITARDTVNQDVGKATDKNTARDTALLHPMFQSALRKAPLDAKKILAGHYQEETFDQYSSDTGYGENWYNLLVETGELGMNGRGKRKALEQIRKSNPAKLKNRLGELVGDSPDTTNGADALHISRRGELIRFHQQAMLILIDKVSVLLGKSNPAFAELQKAQKHFYNNVQYGMAAAAKTALLGALGGNPLTVKELAAIPRPAGGDSKYAAAVAYSSMVSIGSTLGIKTLVNIPNLYSNMRVDKTGGGGAKTDMIPFQYTTRGLVATDPGATDVQKSVEVMQADRDYLNGTTALVTFQSIDLRDVSLGIDLGTNISYLPFSFSGKLKVNWATGEGVGEYTQLYTHYTNIRELFTTSTGGLQDLIKNGPDLDIFGFKADESKLATADSSYSGLQNYCIRMQNVYIQILNSTGYMAHLVAKPAVNVQSYQPDVLLTHIKLDRWGAGNLATYTKHPIIKTFIFLRHYLYIHYCVFSTAMTALINVEKTNEPLFTDIQAKRPGDLAAKGTIFNSVVTEIGKHKTKALPNMDPITSSNTQLGTLNALSIAQSATLPTAVMARLNEIQDYLEPRLIKMTTMYLAPFLGPTAASSIFTTDPGTGAVIRNDHLIGEIVKRLKGHIGDEEVATALGRVNKARMVATPAGPSAANPELNGKWYLVQANNVFNPARYDGTDLPNRVSIMLIDFYHNILRVMKRKVQNMVRTTDPSIKGEVWAIMSRGYTFAIPGMGNMELNNLVPAGSVPALTAKSHVYYGDSASAASLVGKATKLSTSVAQALEGKKGLEKERKISEAQELLDLAVNQYTQRIEQSHLLADNYYQVFKMLLFSPHVMSNVRTSTDQLVHVLSSISNAYRGMVEAEAAIVTGTLKLDDQNNVIGSQQTVNQVLAISKPISDKVYVRVSPGVVEYYYDVIDKLLGCLKKKELDEYNDVETFFYLFYYKSLIQIHSVFASVLNYVRNSPDPDIVSKKIQINRLGEDLRAVFHQFNSLWEILSQYASRSISRFQVHIRINDYLSASQNKQVDEDTDIDIADKPKYMSSKPNTAEYNNTRTAGNHVFDNEGNSLKVDFHFLDTIRADKREDPKAFADYYPEVYKKKDGISFHRIYDSRKYATSEVVANYMSIAPNINQGKGTAIMTYGYSGSGKTVSMFGNSSMQGVLQTAMGGISSDSKIYMRVYEIYGFGHPYNFYWNRDTSGVHEGQATVNQCLIHHVLGKVGGTKLEGVDRLVFTNRADMFSYIGELRDPSTPSTVVQQVNDPNLQGSQGYNHYFDGGNKLRQSSYTKIDQADWLYFDDFIRSLDVKRAEGLDIHFTRTAKYQQIKTTVNNPESSRSILVYDFQVGTDDGSGTGHYNYTPFIIYDLPGKEDIGRTYVEPNAGTKVIKKEAIFHDLKSDNTKWKKSVLVSNPLLIPLVIKDYFPPKYDDKGHMVITILQGLENIRTGGSSSAKRAASNILTRLLNQDYNVGQLNGTNTGVVFTNTTSVGSLFDPTTPPTTFTDLYDKSKYLKALFATKANDNAASTAMLDKGFFSASYYNRRGKKDESQEEVIINIRIQIFIVLIALLMEYKMHDIIFRLINHAAGSAEGWSEEKVQAFAEGYYINENVMGLLEYMLKDISGVEKGAPQQISAKKDEHERAAISAAMRLVTQYNIAYAYGKTGQPMYNLDYGLNVPPEYLVDGGDPIRKETIRNYRKNVRMPHGNSYRDYATTASANEHDARHILQRIGRTIKFQTDMEYNPNYVYRNGEKVEVPGVQYYDPIKGSFTTMKNYPLIKDFLEPYRPKIQFFYVFYVITNNKSVYVGEEQVKLLSSLMSLVEKVSPEAEKEDCDLKLD